MQYHLLDTPTGLFALIEAADGGIRTFWTRGEADPRLAGGRPDPRLRPDLVDRLHRYFAGAPVTFDDVPTPPGATAFFTRCRAACRRIPRGRTLSYGALAVAAGATGGAARAAGQAMRTNPLPIIVPCHRVLAAGGRLGGFAGSDDPAGAMLEVKRRLLEMEGALEPTLLETG